MKHRREWTLFAVFLIAMLIPLLGCGSSDLEKKGSFDGQLIGATDETLVVAGDSETKDFSTTGETTIDLGEESELTEGDMLSVTYHSEGDGLIADTVKLKRAVEKDLTMKGELSDLNEADFTVSSDSLTVVFSYDADTKVDGDLNEGDEVSVIYLGDLSEEPYAVSVRVVKEQKDDPHYEAHGIVSDVSDTSVLLSVDSSGSARFLINGGTVIDSSDQKIEIGDRAEITFTGDINDGAVAAKIIVHYHVSPGQYVINGKLDKAEKTYLELSTGKHTYKIPVNESTRFTGSKYKSGVKATVTYTGKLSDDPLAISVYCGSEKKKEKPAKTAAVPKQTQTKTNPKTKANANANAEAKEETKPPAPVVITADGVIEQWLGNTCFVVVNETITVTLTTENATCTPGYFPQGKDTVLIMYDKDKMDLIDIQLLDRPDPDPSTEEPPDRDEGGKAEPATRATEATEAAEEEAEFYIEPEYDPPTTTTTTAAPEPPPNELEPPPSYLD